MEVLKVNGKICFFLYSPPHDSYSHLLALASHISLLKSNLVALAVEIQSLCAKGKMGIERSEPLISLDPAAMINLLRFDSLFRPSKLCTNSLFLN